VISIVVMLSHIVGYSLFPYLGISAIGTPQTSRLHDLEKVSNKLPFGT